MSTDLRPLSPGERDVWAARAAEALAAGARPEVAASVAARAVIDLRALQARVAAAEAEGEGLVPLSRAARAMLAEMIGGGE